MDKKWVTRRGQKGSVMKIKYLFQTFNILLGYMNLQNNAVTLVYIMANYYFYFVIKRSCFCFFKFCIVDGSEH